MTGPQLETLCEELNGGASIGSTLRSEGAAAGDRAEHQQLAIVPTSIFDAIDLSIHAFDYALAFRWGDYELVCCQNYTNAVANPYNSVMYARSVYSEAIDKIDFLASCLEIFDGALIAGDPLSNNVFTLFSGFDDDETAIETHWQDGQLNLGAGRLKRAHQMRVTGLIQKEQDIKVSLVLDDGTPVEAFTIMGDGAYVDQGVNTPTDSYTVGSKVIGGGGEATAHPFDVTFPIHTDIFQNISARFQALNIGHAAINSYTTRTCGIRAAEACRSRRFSLSLAFRRQLLIDSSPVRHIKDVVSRGRSITAGLADDQALRAFD